MKGGLGHISSKKNVWLFRKDRRINLAFWRYTDILNYPKTGSLAKNHFWFVATQKERSVLIIQMLFSWFSCGSDQWLSASTKSLCVLFLILKFSSTGLVSVLMRRNGNRWFFTKEFQRKYWRWSPFIVQSRGCISFSFFLDSYYALP